MTIEGVFVADEQRDLPVDIERWSRLATAVLNHEGVDPDVQVAVVFVDTDAITALNRQFLEQDRPTDVLAFPIDEEVAQSGRRPDQGGRGPGSGSDDTDTPLMLGDVYVCPAVARGHAGERGIDVDDELALLVVHGLLHLLGRDHREPGERAEMQARERELLLAYGELRSPIERVHVYPDAGTEAG